jgi:UDP-D-galactose:(glucosyl)LPS alpha-1,6-D-galactosyltransferase
MIKFVASHLSGNGGTETVLSEVLNHLALNQQVELIIFGNPTNRYWLDNLNSNVIVKIENPQSKLAKLQSYFKTAFKVKSDDLVISLSPSFIKVLSFARKVSGRKFKIISWIHFSLDDQDLFDPTNIKYADYHLAISNKIRKQLINLGIPSDRIDVIYNPVEKQSATSIKEHSGTNLAYIGRITFEGQKNLKELFTALNGISSVHLYLIGTGSKEEIDRCKRFIENSGNSAKVTWAGWQKQPWNYLADKNIDASILTSTFEGLPMALLESIVRGIPVIASRFDGYSDVVKEHTNGLSYQMGDVDQLRDCIFKIKSINNPKQIQNSISNYYSEIYFANLDNIIHTF